tara:strand:+ start:414 stop:1295 length:882 start_codon:yes stop_codon:yes gene_type:complete
MIVHKDLTLLTGTQNVLRVTQSAIDAYKVDDADKSLIISSIDLFSKRSKNHITYQILKPHLDNKFANIDFVRMKDYPLPAGFNEATRRPFANVTSLGRRSITSIEQRDLYTLSIYTIVCGSLSGRKDIPSTYWDIYADYMSGLFLRIFGKRYGLVGSYVDLIPELRYLVSAYIGISFFGFSQKDAFKKAISKSRYDVKKLKINLNDYDFSQLRDLIKALSDGAVLPGINMYSFVSSTINSFGIVNIPMFEDAMRFNTTIFTSTINGNALCPTQAFIFNQSLYTKIVSLVAKTI